MGSTFRWESGQYPPGVKNGRSGLTRDRSDGRCRGMMRWLLVMALLAFAACGDLSPTGTVERGIPIKERAQRLRIRQEIREFERELVQRFARDGEWPDDWSFLRRSANDPWGNEYRFYVEDDIAVVFSAGPDGEPDTKDDVHGK